MPKQTVYIESSIPSFYFSTRTSAKSVAWRQITRSWWHDQGPHFDLVTSGTVHAELLRAPGEKATQLMSLLSKVRLLEEMPEIAAAVKQYMKHKLTPSSPEGRGRNDRRVFRECEAIRVERRTSADEAVAPQVIAKIKVRSCSLHMAPAKTAA